MQDLLFVKDIELKRLGIQNARDRSTMINSLSSIAPRPYDGKWLSFLELYIINSIRMVIVYTVEPVFE